MDATGSSSVSPDDLQDELQAALADIERMSGESSVAAVATSDGRGETVDSWSAEQAAPRQPESAAGESTAADNASTTHVEAPHVSPTDADAADPGPTIDEQPSLPAAPGSAEPTEAPQEPSLNGGANDPAPLSPNKTPAPSEPDPNTPATTETTAPSHESMLLADQELAAELKRIEQMSSEEVASIPSLDDGNEQTEDSATPEDQRAFPEGEHAPDSETELDDEELTAAFAEVEKTAADLKTDPPRPGAANADAPDGSARPESAVSSDPAPPVGAEPPSEAAPATPQGGRRKPRFQVGEKPAESVAVPGPPDQHWHAGPIARPVVPLAKRVSRAVDNGLDTINQPFERMDRRTRTLVGCVAATTLLMSILAMILMPLFMPHRDAIVFLQEKKAALRSPPPVEQADQATAGNEQAP